MQLPDSIILAVIPLNKNLLSPTMKEIYEHLKGRLLFGEGQLTNQVDHFVTGAMQLPHFLNYIKENVLIVTPGDRGDIIIGALQANLSAQLSQSGRHCTYRRHRTRRTDHATDRRFAHHYSHYFGTNRHF